MWNCFDVCCPAHPVALSTRQVGWSWSFVLWSSHCKAASPVIRSKDQTTIPSNKRRSCLNCVQVMKTTTCMCLWVDTHILLLLDEHHIFFLKIKTDSCSEIKTPVAMTGKSRLFFGQAVFKKLNTERLQVVLKFVFVLLNASLFQCMLMQH